MKTHVGFTLLSLIPEMGLEITTGLHYLIIESLDIYAEKNMS